MQITPSKLTELCTELTCHKDILETCPKELLSNDGTVCSSACKKGIGEYSDLDDTSGTHTYFDFTSQPKACTRTPRQARQYQEVAIVARVGLA